MTAIHTTVSLHNSQPNDIINMSKHASLVLLLVAEASAAKGCTTSYSDATCSSQVSRECVDIPTDGSCMPSAATPEEVGQGILMRYANYSCNTAGDAITQTVYSSADCSGTSTGSATIDGSGACTDLFGIASMKIEFDCSAGGSDPCFADSTMACRLIDSS